MITRGLLIRWEAKRSKGADTEEFLQSALPLVQDETGTLAWFAVKFSGREREYGLFSVFGDDVDREVHLNGDVSRALKAHVPELFVQSPRIESVEVLASKMPVTPPMEFIRKGILLKLRPKERHSSEMEEFIRDGKAFVQEEPRTVAWFGLRLTDGSFGLFDVFPDQEGRLAHLAGQLPLELAKHSISLLGDAPEIEMLDILAENLVIPIPV
jgi:quinol monooxygenase YgiN